ncbi:MAG: hypothetical protein ACUVSQ_12215, partial [Pseudanabaenaceae cyanobacterium]
PVTAPPVVVPEAISLPEVAEPPPADVLAQLLGEEIAPEMDTTPQAVVESRDETAPALPEEPVVSAPVLPEISDSEDESLILLPTPLPAPEAIPPELIEALQFDLAHPETTAPLPEILPEPSPSATGFAERDLDAALALLDLPTLPTEELIADSPEALVESFGDESLLAGLFDEEEMPTPEPQAEGFVEAASTTALEREEREPSLLEDLTLGEAPADRSVEFEAIAPLAADWLGADTVTPEIEPLALAEETGDGVELPAVLELAPLGSAEGLPGDLFRETDPLAALLPELELPLAEPPTATRAAPTEAVPEDLDNLLAGSELDTLLELTEPIAPAPVVDMNRELDNELDDLLHNLTEPELPKREQFDLGEEDLSETLLESPTEPTFVEEVPPGEVALADLDDLFEVSTAPPPEDLDELLNVAIDHEKLNRFADDFTEEPVAEPVSLAEETPTTAPTLWEMAPATSTVVQIEDRVPPALDTYSPTDPWFLGLDFGQRTVQAALSNVATGKVYPLTIEDMAALPNQIGSPETGFLREYTQLLRMGVPYRSGDTWQPVIQWAPDRLLDLQTLRQEVELLLTRLGNGAAHPRLPANLPPIAGVAFGVPTDWPDTYAVNLREALLRAGLVVSSERAIAVEQPLALFLHLLHTRPDLTYPVLILDAGTLSTQLLLAREPERSGMGIRGFDYGGSGLDEDIAARLLYPYWRAIAPEASDPCNLDGLTLPNPGDADPGRRVRLRQALNAPHGGQDLLRTAETVKMTLTANPHLTEWRGTVGDMPVVVLRREFDGQIMQPYVQRLNREINLLLSTAGLLAEDVAQIWLTGETSHQPTLVSWLQQKFPQVERFALDDAALASGLAVAPRYRHLLDLGRQQYSDYFLLYEICRLNPKTPFHVNRLLQQLQARGINIKTCRDRILDLLQGEMPRGLLPWLEPEGAIVLDDPNLGPELREGRLFELETDGSYRPNVKKLQQLRTYLQTLLAQMQQSFEEPAVFPDLLAEAVL